ncbi:hypothetical protein B0H14DRAFT_3088892 [Mycena olivaceomarginata]|nr:hypothetical protein B0H14DRAFT_3088892 [Mycena olivaceomarginata]
MSSSPTNYAASSGIHSVAAAAIFALLFFPLFIWFIRQSIRNTTFVYIIFALFCQMRVLAFVLRAIMAHSTSAGSNLNLFIVDQVLFGVGFFALLYSAYTLVLDRDVLAGGKRGSLFSCNPLRNPHAFHMALMGAVVIGVIATVNSTSDNADDVSTGHNLRKVSTIIFLGLTFLQAVQTVWFFRDTTGSKSSMRPWGDRSGRYILCLISLLMIVREFFLAVTMNDAAKQNKEHLWYPFVALPELLAVVCYSVSGLVPTRAALRAGLGNGIELRLQADYGIFFRFPSLF